MGSCRPEGLQTAWLPSKGGGYPANRTAGVAQRWPNPVSGRNNSLLPRYLTALHTSQGHPARPHVPSHVYLAFSRCPSAPACSGRCCVGWGGSAWPGALPPCAPSEETSQELSAGRAAPGHRQGHKAQLAVEAQLLPVGVTDLAEHSPRPWKGGERSEHRDLSAGTGGAVTGTPSIRASMSPLPLCHRVPL